jgi:hypothetical protein
MASSGPPKTLLNIALAENARLLEENARLRKLFAERQATHALPDAAPQAPASVKPLARREQELRNIALFHSLFRGREDVYAIRWQGREGKSGYAPAAIQDWDPGLLESDRAAKRRFDSKRRAGANVRMNELLKLLVDSSANRQGNALVRSRVQRRGAVIGVEDLIGKVGEWKQ